MYTIENNLKNTGEFGVCRECERLRKLKIYDKGDRSKIVGRKTRVKKKKKENLLSFTKAIKQRTKPT